MSDQHQHQEKKTTLPEQEGATPNMQKISSTDATTKRTKRNFAGVSTKGVSTSSDISEESVVLNNGKLMLVLGATSDIARATINEFAKQGWSFHLAARSEDQLQQLADDISVRTGKSVSYSYFDAVEMGIDEMQGFWQHVLEGDPVPDSKPETAPQLELDALFCAVGMLGDQVAAQSDALLTQHMMQANFTGLLPVLAAAADYFEARQAGHIIVISSVAGDRGRGSNYVYGAAKAGLSAYLSGLRVRLNASKVQVLTVLPGFVKTKMVAGLQLPGMLTITPEQAAADIMQAVHKGKDKLYTKWWWFFIMLIIKHIPERIFKKLRNL